MTLPYAPPPVRLRRTTPPSSAQPAGTGLIVVACGWCGAESDPIPAARYGYRASLMAAHGGLNDLEAPAECPNAIGKVQP